jgi:hypothetical protein
MEGKEKHISNKQLRRAAAKAFKSVEKMIQEEPQTTVISDGSDSASNGTLKEINDWLFHRSYNDDNERNTNSN